MDVTSATIDPSIWDANHAALRTADPRMAERLSHADQPADVRPVLGRDGTVTFVWSDGEGRLKWFGRTSMPTVSGAALVDAFDPGAGNVLLRGIGSGCEARLLLDRLAAHQALFVLEDEPWQVALALQRWDFSVDIRARRLILLTGSDVWTELGRFLIENDGYLTPERVLAWPTFRPADIRDVTTRLHGTATAVSQARAPNDAQISPSPTARQSGAGRLARIAIVSNLPDASIHELSRRIGAQCAAMDWPYARFVLDSPAHVHPRCVERELAEFDATMMLVLGVMPAGLPYRLGPAPTGVVCVHAESLSAEWLMQLPDAACLGVATHRQREQAVSAGIAPEAVVVLPPTAVASGESIGEPNSSCLVFVGDLPAHDATSVGIHLDSQVRLWAEAERALAERVDAYEDSDADAILATAEKRTHQRIEAAEVRAAIVARIRRHLGPALIRKACVRAMIETGADVQVIGRGWEREPTINVKHTPIWRSWEEGTSVLSSRALVMAAEPSGRVLPAWLDCLASGLVGMVRRHSIDETPEGLAGVLDPKKHVARFKTRRELLEFLREFKRDPSQALERAHIAAELIRSRHTWRQRLTALQSACEARWAGR